MSFRSIRSAAFLLVSTAALVAAGSFAVAACSSTTPAESGGADSGPDGTAPPKPRPDSGGDPDSGTVSREQCLKDCLENAPANVKAAYEAVDDCWATHCDDPCNSQTGVFDAGAQDSGTQDAGADADAGSTPDAGEGLCGTSVGSGLPEDVEQACNGCTEKFCCSQWSTCYASGLCNPVDECRAECE